MRMGPRRTCLLAVLAAAVACGSDLPTEPERTCPAPARPSARVELPPGPAACPTAAAIAGLGIPVSFEGDIGGSTLVCRAADGSLDLNVVQKNVYNALLFMQRVEFDTPLPWTDKTLWEWFRSAVWGVRIRTDIETHLCCAPFRVINLLGTIITDSTLPAEYVSMMVHEGRHADGPRHTCGGQMTEFGRVFTLDQRVSDMGAFGVQYSVLQWIGLHWREATQADRDYALNRAAWLRLTAFCYECQE
jgi:hypothetical protein